MFEKKMMTIRWELENKGCELLSYLGLGPNTTAAYGSPCRLLEHSRLVSLQKGDESSCFRGWLEG